MKVVDCLEGKLQLRRNCLVALLNENQIKPHIKLHHTSNLTHAMLRLAALQAPPKLDQVVVVLARGVMPVPAR